MHSDTETAGPPVRHPHIRAALPVLVGDTDLDIETLQRVAAALRAGTGDDRTEPRPDTLAAIARLRRDMGDTIADLWSAPLEQVCCA